MFRDGYDNDIWINTLFNQYKPIYRDPRVESVQGFGTDMKYPNWIITDVRYKNEAEIIKNKGGILIRINRWIDKIIPKDIIAQLSEKTGIYGIYPDGSEALIENIENLDNFEYFATELQRIDNVSETDLDNYEGFDYVIENNSVNITVLIEKISFILKERGLII